MKAIKLKEARILVVTNRMEVAIKGGPANLEFLQQTLDKYQTTFNMPIGLPKIQGHDHSFNFKEGSQPISVRPY